MYGFSCILIILSREFSDFELSLQEIVYPNKFERLTHAKILGTVLNKLGIDRKLFGDILVNEESTDYH